MKIRIDPHTAARAIERGTDEGEIRDVIETGRPISTRLGRSGKAKVYSFGRERLGKAYPQKRVEVVYVMEQDIAVTVYVFFGTDLLYLRFDEREQQVENRRLADDIVLDIGEGGKIVGIEILDASRHVNLQNLLPTRYQVTS